ncbi:ectin-like [Orbicella faveolata]|uniref:ectin-like n=1 Tax=Orbicella faveolata TaxID=48498 RepID=UPI0009E2BB3F|nr:ectin-like [Orbicella faveolata]
MDDLCIYWSAVLASIQSDCLKQHNLHRRQHQAPDVTYSSELKEKAQSLAEFMAVSDTQLEFFQGSVDENLFHGVSSHPLTISDAIQHWYNRGRFYYYTRPNLSFENTNFIQLVWKSYTKIGCGQAVANKEDGTVSTYIVALYEPPADRSTRKDLLSNVFAPKPKQ